MTKVALVDIPLARANLDLVDIRVNLNILATVYAKLGVTLAGHHVTREILGLGSLKSDRLAIKPELGMPVMLR